MDHYIAIVKPLHYNRIVSNNHTKVVIALIWIVSFIGVALETVPEIFTYYRIDDVENTFCSHMQNEYVSRMPYFLVIPELFVLIGLYARIFITYKKYIIRRLSFHPDDRHNNKAIVTTLLIVGTFMVGWVPYSVLKMLQIFFSGKTIHISEETVEYVWFTTIMCKALIMLNSLCDAIIYALRLDIVKQGYIVLFRKLCRKCQRCFKGRHSAEATDVTSDQVCTTSI